MTQKFWKKNSNECWGYRLCPLWIFQTSSATPSIVVSFTTLKKSVVWNLSWPSSTQKLFVFKLWQYFSIHFVENLSVNNILSNTFVSLYFLLSINLLQKHVQFFLFFQFFTFDIFSVNLNFLGEKCANDLQFFCKRWSNSISTRQYQIEYSASMFR